MIRQIFSCWLFSLFEDVRRKGEGGYSFMVTLSLNQSYCKHPSHWPLGNISILIDFFSRVQCYGILLINFHALKLLDCLNQSTISHKMFGNQFSCEISHCEKNSISVFQEIFTVTDKIFISGGGLSTRQLFYEVLKFSSYFLIS